MTYTKGNWIQFGFDVIIRTLIASVHFRQKLGIIAVGKDAFFLNNGEEPCWFFIHQINAGLIALVLYLLPWNLFSDVYLLFKSFTFGFARQRYILVVLIERVVD